MRTCGALDYSDPPSAGHSPRAKPMVGFGDPIFNPDEPAANEAARYASSPSATFCRPSCPARPRSRRRARRAACSGPPGCRGHPASECPSRSLSASDDFDGPALRRRPFVHRSYQSTQGVTLAASSRRRSKTRRDPFSASSNTAQSRCSSTSLPPLMAHKRPALARCARGRLRQQPNKANAFQPNLAARSAQFSCETKKLLQSRKNCCHRC
jgi:hypothetical protein